MRFYLYIFCWVFCLKGLYLLNDFTKNDIFKWSPYIFDKTIYFLFLLKIILMTLGVFRGLIWWKERSLDAPHTFKNSYISIMLVVIFLAILVIVSIFSSSSLVLFSINSYKLLYFILTSLCMLFIVIEVIDQKNRLLELSKGFKKVKGSIIKALCKTLIKDAQASIGLVYRELNPDSNGMVSAGDLMSQPWDFACYLAEKNDMFDAVRDMTHIVIGKNKYDLFSHSSDPREPSNLHVFTNCIDLVRYCVLMQINVAVRLALSEDSSYLALDSKKSYEDFEKKSYLLIECQEIIKENLSRFLQSKKARFINWFINFLV